MDRFILVLVTDKISDRLADKVSHLITQPTKNSGSGSEVTERGKQSFAAKPKESLLDRPRNHYVNVVQSRHKNDDNPAEPEWEELILSVQDDGNHGLEIKMPKCFQCLQKQDDENNVQYNYSDTFVADQLHHIADKLPVPGSFLLDILWLTSGEEDFQVQGHLHLFGVLQRLQEWYNGNFTILSDRSLMGSTSSEMSGWKKWISYLSASVMSLDSGILGEDVPLCSNQNVVWKGWIKLTESRGVSSVSLPGFHLTKWEEDKSLSHQKSQAKFSVDFHQQTQEKTQQDELAMICAKNLDVVKVVKLEEIPAYFLSPIKYKLKLTPTQGANFDRSKIFLEWLCDAQNEIGVLTQLECKVCDDEAIHGTRQQYTTSKWKESVLKNPNDTTAPDVNIKGRLRNFQFLIIGNSSFECTAYMLHSVEELNGSVGHKLALWENTETTEQESKVTAREVLQELPLFDIGDLWKMENDLQEAQASAIKKWIDDRQNENLITSITHSELINVLDSARKEYLKHFTTDRTCRVTWSEELTDNLPTELDLSPSEWPERQALLNKESMSKKLQRIKTEDMMFRGEVIRAPDPDDSVRLDVREFLKYFKTSGEPAADDLSPVGVSDSNNRESSTTKLPMAVPNIERLSKADFKETLRMNYHGLNFCVESRNAEQLNERLNNLQSRYITHETSSTCTLEQASSPATMAMLAPSPAMPSSPHEEETTTDAKQRGRPTRLSSSQTPGSQKRKRKTTPSDGSISLKRPVRSSPRRVSLPRIAAIKKEESRTGVLRGQGSSRPRSASVGSGRAGIKSESRSEKHKRQLRYIVDDNLKKHGVTKDHACYGQCVTRLYNLSKSFLKDLKTSHGLVKEMKNVVESNVEQVVSFELRRANKV
ncbi:mdm2-binding protein-like [Glandiceps talaboti]